MGLLTTGGGRLAGVDVADDDDVDVSLLLTTSIVSMMCGDGGKCGQPVSCRASAWRLGCAYPMVTVVCWKLR
jgi:hypothetical protein